MEFNCIDEANKFYNRHAKVTRFSVQKDDLKHEYNGNIIYRKWVYSKEGYQLEKCFRNENQQREPRSLTRVGCEAAFCIGFSQNLEKWIVKEFSGEYDHPLVNVIDTISLVSSSTN